MKNKFFKFLSAFGAICLLFIAVFVLGESRVEAATSYDLYYPNEILASGYKEDGSVSIKNQIVVYGHNNGYGYRLDGRDIKISSVTVTVGNTEKTLDISNHDNDYLKVETKQSIPSDGRYGSSVNFNKNTVDKITLYMSNIYSSLGITSTSTDYLKNSVKVKINLQKSNIILFVIAGWNDIDNNDTYFGGVKQSGKTVTFSKTDSSFASNNFRVNDVSVVIEEEMRKLKITTNIAIKGYLNIRISEGNSSRDVILYFNGNVSSTKIEVLNYTGGSISIRPHRTTKDLYGAAIVETSSNIKNVTLDLLPPTVSVEVNANNIYEYQNTTYYSNGENLLTFRLSDDNTNKYLYYKVCESLCDIEYSVLSGNAISVSLPNRGSSWTIHYYTSDGINTSSEASETFSYRGAVDLKTTKISVNGNSITSADMDIKTPYNYLTISYQDAGGADLLKSITVNVSTSSSSTTLNNSSVKTSETFNFEIIQTFGNVETTGSVEIIFEDLLGNRLSYVVSVKLDTLAPNFNDIVVENTKDGDNYTVEVSGFDDNSIWVEINGIKTNLVNDKFTTTSTQYVMFLQDAAGNKNSKTFTTISPAIQLLLLNTTSTELRYEIYVTDFVASLHNIDSVKYLVFEYNTEITTQMMEVARNNVCTVGRKVNCYVEGSFTSNVGQIYHNFTKGYSYILDIKINNVLANAIGTNQAPRLDLVGPDNTIPVGGYLDDDVNPEYVSSESGKSFTFSFIATDVNLEEKYYYMIVESSIKNNMTVEMFYRLYASCYGDVSTNNKCGYKGENQYKEAIDASQGKYLGEIIFTANNNTRKRMLANKEYSVFVLLVDESTNATLFKVKDFTNITHSSNIQYKNDSKLFEVVNNGQEVVTVDTTSYKITTYSNIKISKLIVNNEEKTCNATSGCQYDLGIGKYIVKVEDELGNVNEVTLYSATANRPKVYVTYLYNNEYFRILDNTLSYNTNNASNVFVKVVGNNLSSIKISMDVDKTYYSGNTIYDNLVGDSEHGYSLADIMSGHNGGAYSGNVVIDAINSDGGNTSITLTVDNEAPDITLKVAGKNAVDLLGTFYDLDYLNGEYSLNYNYQRDITYSLLMNALSLSVDGVSFEEIKNNNRFSLKINDNYVTDYNETIDLGNHTISVNYLDKAGNGANSVTLKLNVVDNEKPHISLVEKLEVAETHTEVSLSTIAVEDNYNNVETLVIKAQINGKDIDYSKHIFTVVGTYTITYTVEDSSANKAQVTQTVLVMDTLAPVLKPGTVTEYTLGLEETLEIAIPVFVDGDTENDIYKPYSIEIKDTNGNVIKSNSSNYPLEIGQNTVTLKFNNNMTIGTYTLLFTAKDTQNNAVIGEYRIHVNDDSAPEIEVKINGATVTNGMTVLCGKDTSVNVVATASDAYQGDLTSKIITKILYNNKEVSSIDTSKDGQYTLTFTVKDNNDNTTIVMIIVKIEEDTQAPIVNKVTINGVTLSEVNTVKVGGTKLTPIVDASDDSNLIISTITFNDIDQIESGESLLLTSQLSGKLFTVKIEVKDISGNLVEKNYRILVDNVAPLIGGIENTYVYTNEKEISIYDDNIEYVDIYKNNSLKYQYNGNVTSLVINEEGIYRVIARDTYGNITDYVFAIRSTKKINIVTGTNSYNETSFDEAFLIEVKIDQDCLTFILGSKEIVSKNDKVYILVKYPHSVYKQVVYSMNGSNYLANDDMTTNTNISPNVSNVSLLEEINGKYYTYAILINNSADVEQVEEKSNNATIAWVILGLVVVPFVLFLLIKSRRRVRAI